MQTAIRPEGAEGDPAPPSAAPPSAAPPSALAILSGALTTPRLRFVDVELSVDEVCGIESRTRTPRSDLLLGSNPHSDLWG